MYVSIYISDYDKKRTLKIVFTDAIISHYLGEKLTVEYDVQVKSLLKKNFAPILYQRCCTLEIRILFSA